MLSEAEVNHRWNEFKTEMRKMWSQLSDSDLDQTRGDRASLIELLHDRYHLNATEAETQLNDVIASFRRLQKEHNEDQLEPDLSAHEKREDVHGFMRDQYRQF